MTENSKREDEALGALIAAAYRQGESDCPELHELHRQARFLTEDDRAALRQLPSDFVHQIMKGSWRPTDCGEDVAIVEDEELLTAMNRGDEDGALTDEARDEMERKLKELDDSEEEEDQG